MREIEDRALEALLIRTLPEHAEEIAFSLTPDVVRARLEDRRRSAAPSDAPGDGSCCSAWPPCCSCRSGCSSVVPFGPNGSPGSTDPVPRPPRSLHRPPNPGDRTTGDRPPAARTASAAQVADLYQALVARYEGDAAVIVAVRGDRQERVVASIPSLDGSLDRPVRRRLARGALQGRVGIHRPS